MQMQHKMNIKQQLANITSQTEVSCEWCLLYVTVSYISLAGLDICQQQTKLATL